MTFKEYFSRDILVETTITGPTAGQGPHTTAIAQFNNVLRIARGAVRGQHFNPDGTNVPEEWNVEPGNELPNKQVFIVDDKLGVEVAFKPTNRYKGRITGDWRVTKTWNQYWD